MSTVMPDWFRRQARPSPCLQYHPSGHHRRHQRVLHRPCPPGIHTSLSPWRHASPPHPSLVPPHTHATRQHSSPPPHPRQAAGRSRCSRSVPPAQAATGGRIPCPGKGRLCVALLWLQVGVLPGVQVADPPRLCMVTGHTADPSPEGAAAIQVTPCSSVTSNAMQQRDQ